MTDELLNTLTYCSNTGGLPEGFPIIAAFDQLAMRMNTEITLSNVVSDELCAQFDANLSLIAIEGDEIVGHMTLRNIGVEGWFMHSSSWVRKDMRRIRLYQRLFTRMEEIHGEKNMIGKSASVEARKAGKRFKLVPATRRAFPEPVWRTVCSSHCPRITDPGQIDGCPIAHGENQCEVPTGPDSNACVFRTNQRTAERMGIKPFRPPEGFEDDP